MHKEFLELLEEAVGRSEYVIVINLDIRSFTPFCQAVESVNVATYIKKVYLKIVKEYFKNASYYKPTGDGLILVVPYSEANLRDVARTTIGSCLRLLESFGSLLANDPMINFPAPRKIGIGVVRGSACCIFSKDKEGNEKILDYSGRILNLASRLMDIARPCGIVLDDSFGIELLQDETKEMFSEEAVYLRGVSEEETMRIWYTRKHTLISDLHKQPIKEPKWYTETWKYTFEELRKIAGKRGVVRCDLDRKPSDEHKIMADIFFKSTRMRETTDVILHYDIDDCDFIQYVRRGKAYVVLIEAEAVNKHLASEELPKEADVTIDVTYPAR